MKADKIIRGGTFYRGNGLDNDIDFVAIRGNKILAVGKEAEIDEYVDAETEILEFTKDNLITAGLHDNHIHLIQAGMLMKYVSLYDAKSREEVAELLKQYADEHPDEEWVVGIGYMKNEWTGSREITKEFLDQFIEDRPVFAFDCELHEAWLNTRAMAKAGITKDTPEVDGGRIDRNEDGTPKGTLVDNAISIGAAPLFDFDKELVKELINNYTDYALKMGITSVSDMCPYLALDLSYPDVYFDMVANDELRIRINAARNLFEDVEIYNPLRAKAATSGKGMYRVVYMKQFIDGTPAAHTGWLLEDYSDMPGFKGAPTLDVQKMRDAVEVATANDISVRLHACGDAACRAAVSAYENAMTKYPDSKSRHMVEHMESTSLQDLEKFAKYGIIASMQPEHPCPWPQTYVTDNFPGTLGPERIKYSWPWRTLLNLGATLAAGSDAPVVEGNPYWGIFGGNTRLYADLLPKGGFVPEQLITIAELLDAYTMGAAFAEHREDELGTLEVGKLADITVIDRNLFELEDCLENQLKIRDAKALLTMVDGKIMYKCV